MARSLTIQRAMVPANDRAKYLQGLRAKLAHYQSLDCRFWVFEEVGLPGLFIEFTEGGDPEHLRAAHAKSPGPPRDPNRIYTEVEIR